MNNNYNKLYKTNYLLMTHATNHRIITKHKIDCLIYNSFTSPDTSEIIQSQVLSRVIYVAVLHPSLIVDPLPALGLKSYEYKSLSSCLLLCANVPMPIMTDLFLPHNLPFTDNLLMNILRCSTTSSD